MSITFKNVVLHNVGTLKHKGWVLILLLLFCIRIMWRAFRHDFSKFRWRESKGFYQVIHKLRSLTYGSEEYNSILGVIKNELEFHYASNRHHPEHFKDGIEEMSLDDIVVMLYDWKAATKRHKDGDIIESIKHNKKRFKMSDQLATIFINSVGKRF